MNKIVEFELFLSQLKMLKLMTAVGKFQPSSSRLSMAWFNFSESIIHLSLKKSKVLAQIHMFRIESSAEQQI